MKWTPLFVVLAALLLTAEPPKRVPPEAAKTVARINELRKIAGLKPVEFDAELSDGCEKHSKYLVLNDNRVWTEKGFDAHDEVEAYSGFTKEGRKAGKSGVISWQEPLPAVDGHFAGLFHRVPLLNPRLKRVAIGRAAGGKWGAVSVIDVLSGVEAGADWPKDLVVLYPANGQRGVPAELGNEIPNPIPEDPDRRGGFPITATFEPGVKVTDATATLTDARSRQPVEFWLSSPEKPADARYQRNTICLIAKNALGGGATYQVTVRAKADGKAWEKTWTFTTAGAAK